MGRQPNRLSRNDGSKGGLLISPAKALRKASRAGAKKKGLALKGEQEASLELKRKTALIRD